MKQRVFVSSGQKELAAERPALKNNIQGDALLGLFFEVFLFEDMPASDRRADEVYLKQVDRCDVYPGLLGTGYNYEDAQGVSSTEREFHRDTAAAKECLIFVKGDHDPTRHPKMQAFVRKAAKQLVRRRTRPFDAAVCSEATLHDLSRQKVQEFLARAQSERNYSLRPRMHAVKALAHLNLLGGGWPSHAAMRHFGKQPQRFLITSEVKYLQFRGTIVVKPIQDYKIFKGAVFELVDQAVGFVMSKLAASVGTRAQSNRAPVTDEVPRLAVAEAIVNAIAHRDYTSNSPMQVMLFADWMEVWNPGRLPPSLTPAALRGPHASIPHNPLITEPLFLTRDIEKAGTGILDMIVLCKEAKLRPPEFQQESGQFIQTLWRPTPAPTPLATQSPSQAGTKSGLSRDQVAFLRNSLSEQSLLELMADVGKKSRTRFRDQVINPLLAQGLWEMTITDKSNSRSQKYRLTAKGRKARGRSQ